MSNSKKLLTEKSFSFSRSNSSFNFQFKDKRKSLNPLNNTIYLARIQPYFENSESKSNYKSNHMIPVKKQTKLDDSLTSTINFNSRNSL